MPTIPVKSDNKVKFRIFCEVTNTYIHWPDVFSISNLFDIFEGKLPGFTVQQYVGEIDSRGIEIYVGDKVLVPGGYGGPGDDRYYTKCKGTIIRSGMSINILNDTTLHPIGQTVLWDEVTVVDPELTFIPYSGIGWKHVSEQE